MVKVDLKDERARLMICRMLRARDGLKSAFENQNLGEAGYYFGWLDAELTELFGATPIDELFPDEPPTGNETNKP